MSGRRPGPALLRLVRPDEEGRARITGRKIYILPTGYGLVFGVLLVTLLIASINYASNPAFLLTFLLAGIFFQAIFFTWRNLEGLELRLLGAEPVFAGEEARVRCRLYDPRRSHFSLALAFRDAPPAMIDVPAGEEVELELPWPTRRRGLHSPGLLVLESRHPLGLLRAWTRIETDLQVLVWPRPEHFAMEQGAPAWQGSQEGDRGVGSDDFTGYRNYHPGDAPGHIHWKALAAEKGLLVKQFGGDRVERLWLDFEALAPAETEVRLRRLAGAVEELSREPVQFGLRLPEQEIAPAGGPRQRRRCLDALGLFGLSGEPGGRS